MAYPTTFLVLALIVTVSLAFTPKPSKMKPNPCGFAFSGASGIPCKDSRKCAAFTFAGRRAAGCVEFKPNNCICTLEFAPVCCRVKLGKFGTITQTQGNKCGCDCIKGDVVFKRACNDPPLKPAICTEEFDPTCCYIEKFDLTYTAVNPCICKEQAGGIITSDRFCGIKI